MRLGYPQKTGDTLKRGRELMKFEPFSENDSLGCVTVTVSLVVTIFLIYLFIGTLSQFF